MFFGGGIWARYVNFTTIVLTNQRMIFLNTDTKGKPKDMLYYQIRFDVMRKIKAGIFGTFQIKMANKKSRMFREVNSRDRKNLKKRLEEKQGQTQTAQFAQPAASSGGPDNFCPVCLNLVPEKTFQCENCGTTFRTPKAAALRSLILPGWGDLYLKHRTIAVMEIIGALIFYLFMASLIFNALIAPDPEVMAAIPVFIILVILFNVLDSLATLSIGKKGLIPLKAGTTMNQTGQSFN
jgi:hypothetical protein